MLVWQIKSTGSIDDLNELLLEGWEPFSVIYAYNEIPAHKYYLKMKKEIDE